jgi:hypothetical protein
MSDRELREILLDTIRDIDEGRVAIRPPRRSIFRHILAPPLIAASIGLAAGACGGKTSGGGRDAGGQHDVHFVDAADQDGQEPDAGIPDSALPDSALPDSGLEDGDLPDGETGDAETDGDIFTDGEVDGIIVVLYMAPPPDDR